MALQIRDLSSSNSWKIAVGSTNFIVVVEAVVPIKGVHTVLPVFSFQSPLNPNCLTYGNLSEMREAVDKALSFSNCIERAARYDDRMVSAGRRVRVRGDSNQYRIVGIADPREKVYIIQKTEVENPPVLHVSMWDMIPIVEIIDA